MLTLKDYRKYDKGMLQSIDRVEISFEDLKNRAVQKIKERCMAVSLENEDFKNIARKVIHEYLEKAMPACEGYVRDGKLMFETLEHDLFNRITSWGKLTPFKEDSTYRELQLNGPSIFADTKRGLKLFRNPITHEVIRFETPEEAMYFIKDTLNFSGERMTESEPLVNTITQEGFRLSCAHPCIYPSHKSEPGVRWPQATYRKSGAGDMVREDFITFNTLTEDMLEFIEMSMFARFGMVFVGSVGSGKTTLLEQGIKAIDDETRVIVMGAPVENHYRHEVNGMMMNNAVYWQVDSQADKNKVRSANYDNLVTHALRNSGELLIIEESRDKDDFGAAARAMNAGTRVATSMHAFDMKSTIDRFAIELVSKLGVDMEIGRELACNYLRTITLCERIGDKTRKVMGQAEIMGYDRETKKYLINYLYEFVIVKAVKAPGEEGEAGLVSIVGFFVKRNQPSKNYIRNLKVKGVLEEKYENLINKPEGTVLKEVNYELLPEDYVVEYDSDIIPLPNSLRDKKSRDPKDNLGIAV